jgi:hypothetical protein
MKGKREREREKKKILVEVGIKFFFHLVYLNDIDHKI